MKDWPKYAVQFARRELPAVITAADGPEKVFDELAARWRALFPKPAKPKIKDKPPKSTPKSKIDDSGK